MKPILTPETIAILKSLLQLSDQKVERLVECNEKAERTDKETLGLETLGEIAHKWNALAMKNAGRSAELHDG